jgi:CD63 antigen
LVKFIIFFFNFVFVVGGIALIALGAMFYSGYKDYEAVLPDLGPYGYPPILMMVIGAVVFLIAFMGCCGTLRESKCMMLTYATFLLILLVAQIALVVVLVTKKDEALKFFKDEMHESLKKYNEVSEVKEGWDFMQSNLQCCGVEGPLDWGTLKLTESVPKSCCKDQNNCPSSYGIFSSLSNAVQNNYYTDGCLDKVFGSLKSDYGLYGAIALGVVELLGILFGCCLGARFGRKIYNT